MSNLSLQVRSSYALQEHGINPNSPAFCRMMIHDAAIGLTGADFARHVIDAVNGAYDPAVREMTFKAIGAEGEK